MQVLALNSAITYLNDYRTFITLNEDNYNLRTGAFKKVIGHGVQKV